MTLFLGYILTFEFTRSNLFPMKNHLLSPLICTLLLLANLFSGETTMTQPHSLIIIFEAKDGLEAKLKKELQTVPALVADEKELLQYEIYQSLDNNGRFTIYELWTSEKARLRHSQEQYVEEFFERVEPLLKIPHQYMTGVMRGE